MDQRTHDLDTLKADFYLCLARAFMTPQDPLLFPALRNDLADELEDLAGEIGYDIADMLSDYRQRIQAVPGADELLRIYSRLFLQPPRAVHINAGIYLDGSCNGGSVAAMETFYRDCGLERSSEYLDLADHVAIQLEFIAYRYSHSLAAQAGSNAVTHTAGQFIGRFVLRWIEGFCSDLEQAERELGMPGEPYLPLARILRQAAAWDAESFSDLSPAQLRQEKAMASARHKQAEKGIDETDLAEIRRQLEARGLSTDHLGVDPVQRDAMHGWQRMVPPTPRGK